METETLDLEVLAVLEAACAIEGCPGEHAEWWMRCRYCSHGHLIGPDCRGLFEFQSAIRDVEFWECDACHHEEDTISELAEFVAI